jgi:hypothetical protein
MFGVQVKINVQQPLQDGIGVLTQVNVDSKQVHRFLKEYVQRLDQEVGLEVDHVNAMAGQILEQLNVILV